MGMRKLLLLIFTYTLLVMPCFAIKIGLQTHVGRTYIGASASADIIDARNNKLVYTMEKMKGYEIKPYHNVLAIRINGQLMKMKTGTIVIKTEENGFICVKQKWYRGILKIVNDGGALTVINDLPLELYIRGVVPSEMPSSWEHEAHKAQAIAARSYALANLGKRAKYGYDLKDTPEDQAYGGASAETTRTNSAVDETKDIVIVFGGKIVPAYYSASAGGQTNSSGKVWAQDLPFLKSVPSFDDGIKKNGHGVGMSQYGANNLAKKGYNAYQILQYFYSDTKFGKLKEQ